MAKRKWGFILAGIAIAVVLSKKEWREKACVEVKGVKKQAEDAYGFIRDNREEMVNQAKETIEGVNLMWKDLSNDLRTLTNTAAHMKETSDEAIQAAKEAADEIKLLKKEREDV